LADSNRIPAYPTRLELARLSPYEGSKRLVQAFQEAQEELRRRGDSRPTIEAAARLLGPHVSASTYNGSVNHIRAVEVYGISPNLAKMDALRRFRTMEPIPARLAKKLDNVQDQRGDTEILADAVSNLVIRASNELARLDEKALAVYLRRDPRRTTSTHSALIDLQRWLHALEQALDGLPQ
jgi:hypothetical protein